MTASIRRHPSRTRRHAGLAVGLICALALTGCAATTGSTAGSATGSATGSAAGSATGDAPAGGLRVATSFYPLQYATQRVLGPAGTASNLTRPGTEPHDLELTPSDVAVISEAPLVVYLSGFQPAVDTAVAAQAADRGLDVAGAARLIDTAGGAEHADDQAHGHQTAGPDPHFWLDPTRLADVGDAIAKRLAALDPDRAATFTANAAALRRDLLTLDAELAAGLASCASPYLVTSHAAFGYLAQRYRLKQVSIAGLSPEAEPSARTLAEVSDFVRSKAVRTVYFETLVSPAIATTVAQRSSARTAVLDPLEGLTDTSAAQDYLGVMRANLATLRSGQPCP